MKFPVSVETRGGEYVATSLGEPRCAVKGRSREEALDKIRKEIRYRIEHCPCTGVEDDFVELVVI
jgi:predicted RNase H-like HicB family nuclease